METPVMTKSMKISAIKSIQSDLLGQFKMCKSVETKLSGTERLDLEEVKEKLTRFNDVLQDLLGFYIRLAENKDGN